MKRLDVISKKHGEILTELDRLQGEVARCEAAVAAAGRADDAIVELRRKRAEEVATAFIYKRDSSVMDIDAKIAEAETASHQAQLDGEAAKVALEVIEARCADLRVELEGVRAELTTQMLEELSRRYAEAKARFNEAAENIGVHMIEMTAIANARNRLSNRHGSMHQADFLFGKLDSEGLRIIREGDGNMVPPGWMSSFRPTSNERTQHLFGEINKLGVTF